MLSRLSSLSFPAIHYSYYYPDLVEYSRPLIIIEY